MLADMYCLPLYSGDHLTDYCSYASCPDLSGFERFSDQRAMVKVCDYDRDGDGVADVSSSFKPLRADRVGSDQVELLFSQHNGLIIPGLFNDAGGYQGPCPVGLDEVAELEICLTPLKSISFCDRDADCDSAEYCESTEAQCTLKLNVGGRCSLSSDCASGTCSLEHCVDGEIASRCVTDQDCMGDLKCTGQQSAAPGFTPTTGVFACGDAAHSFSPCDPALLSCGEGGSCIEVEFGRYGSDCESYTIYKPGGAISCGEVAECMKVCERLSGAGKMFVCIY